MSFKKEDIDRFIDKADELYKYIESKRGKSKAIEGVDVEFFWLYLYSNALVEQSEALKTQSKRLNGLTIVLAALTFCNLVILIVSIFIYL
jgi:hypothetical protein